MHIYNSSIACECDGIFSLSLKKQLQLYSNKQPNFISQNLANALTHIFIL